MTPLPVPGPHRHPVDASIVPHGCLHDPSCAPCRILHKVYDSSGLEWGS